MSSLKTSTSWWSYLAMSGKNWAGPPALKAGFKNFIGPPSIESNAILPESLSKVFSSLLIKDARLTTVNHFPEMKRKKSYSFVSKTILLKYSKMLKIFKSVQICKMILFSSNQMKQLFHLDFLKMIEWNFTTISLKTLQQCLLILFNNFLLSKCFFRTEICIFLFPLFIEAFLQWKWTTGFRNHCIDF